MTIIALVALPVAFVLAKGDVPYEAVIRVFPGYGVALGSALLLVVSEAASLLSIGDLSMSCSCVTSLRGKASHCRTVWA